MKPAPFTSTPQVNASVDPLFRRLLSLFRHILCQPTTLMGGMVTKVLESWRKRGYAFPQGPAKGPIKSGAPALFPVVEAE
jgi:hypothetical protein